MAKHSDSFKSVIRGVSEQVPHQRYPGQVWAQDNMISDPVVGAVRRAGSVQRDIVAQPWARSAANLEDVGAFREHSLYMGDEEYSFAYRRRPAPAGSTAPPVILVNKTQRKLVPVTVSADAELLAKDGITSIAGAGRYVLFSSASLLPQYTAVDHIAEDSYATAAIRSGNYSRKYTLTLVKKSTNVRYEASYTTPTSYYQGVLDTSDIPIYDPPTSTTPNPMYSKLVNDRTNAYQTAVNQWIGTAAAAIVPSAILTQLRDAIIAAGWPAAGIAVVSNTLVVSDVAAITITDGGDGSSVIATGREVETLTQLTTIHVPGHVVKISPKASSNGAYYVRAKAADGTTVGQWTEVTWEECAGYEITPSFIAMIGTLVSGVMYVAKTPAELGTMTGLTVPSWEPSTSGDLDSQALPALFGSGLPITHMRTFQDRLMVFTGSTCMTSRTGDYFNFFRQSALQVQDDDPIEMYALGSEDDVITDSELLDRDLLLFGDVWQYAISGRDALVPRNALISIQASYPESNRCSPVGAGSFLFYAQPRDHKLTVQQMQTGAYAGTVTSFEVTQQLSRYLQGNPQQLVSTTSPSALFLRTDALKHGLYVYSYLDSPGATERLFDAWHRWTWNTALGTTVAISAKEGALLLLTVRDFGGETGVSLDEFTLSPYSDGPHLDSKRPYSTPKELTVGSANQDQASNVIGAGSSSYALLGRPLAESAVLVEDFPTEVANMVVGYNFDSEYVPTNPFVRDRNDQAILNSRLTLSKYVITVINSAALRVYLQDIETVAQEWQLVEDWIARPVGQWVLNTQQVETSTSIPVGVYKETRNCKISLRSRGWLPMGVSFIEWSGQFFNRR